MNPTTSRWAVAAAAIILLALLFYGIRTERPGNAPVNAAVSTSGPTANSSAKSTPNPSSNASTGAAAPAPAQTSPSPGTSSKSAAVPAPGGTPGGTGHGTPGEQTTPTPTAPGAHSSTAGAAPAAQTAQRDSQRDVQPDAGAPGSNLSSQGAAQAPAVPNFVGLVQAVKPAVVSIRVRSDVTPQVTSGDGGNPFEGSPLERFFRGFGGREGGEPNPQQHLYAQAQGSGFFISKEGYVVTNNHVVANAVKLEVVTDDGRVLDAKVVGTDPRTDLALVKVEGQNFPFVSFADQPPKIGEWVIAMGNPFGLGGTVTAGIVSAQGRHIGAGPYDDFLQIDAAVNRGNSGGPTFNMNAQVIGVNTAIYSPSGGSVGIAFDIPASTVKPVIEQLRQRGYVERGWIGVQVQPVNQAIADSLGMKQAEGALVAGTQPNSPATKAGIKTGDVITTINGNRVKDSRDLARDIAGLHPGSNASIGFLREGREQTASVTIAELKDQTAAARTAPEANRKGNDQRASKLGMAVAPASRVMGIGEQGLAVLRVDPAGKAAEAGLNAGDIILQIGGKEVSSPEDFVNALDEAGKQNKQHVLALVRRNNHDMFIALPASG